MCSESVYRTKIERGCICACIPIFFTKRVPSRAEAPDAQVYHRGVHRTSLLEWPAGGRFEALQILKSSNKSGNGNCGGEGAGHPGQGAHWTGGAGPTTSRGRRIGCMVYSFIAITNRLCIPPYDSYLLNGSTVRTYVKKEAHYW